MFPTEVKGENAVLYRYVNRRELGNGTVFVFDLHVEIVRGKNRGGFRHDCRQFAWRQAVFDIVGHPRLQ
jgi:hypothetical protein